MCSYHKQSPVLTIVGVHIMTPTPSGLCQALVLILCSLLHQYLCASLSTGKALSGAHALALQHLQSTAYECMAMWQALSVAFDVPKRDIDERHCLLTAAKDAALPCDAMSMT
jgi:hypothetical protein